MTSGTAIRPSDQPVRRDGRADTGRGVTKDVREVVRGDGIRLVFVGKHDRDDRRCVVAGTADGAQVQKVPAEATAVVGLGDE